MIRFQIEREDLTVDYVKQMLKYNPSTGEFVWSEFARYPGRVAGCIKQGYVLISVGNKRYAAHRLAWAICNGEFPNGQIDHINMVKTDNRIENLRLANHSQNQGNTVSYGPYRTKGISPLPSGSWQAKIGGKKKVKYLGSYPTKDEAAHAYNKAAIDRFGEFAVLNPVGVDYE